MLVISADDAAALQTLLRPLPHYGGQSYVLFEGGRAASRGIWPVTRIDARLYPAGKLTRQLQGLLHDYLDNER